MIVRLKLVPTPRSYAAPLIWLASRLVYWSNKWEVKVVPNDGIGFARGITKI